jgi:hypothetical protein
MLILVGIRDVGEIGDNGLRGCASFSEFIICIRDVEMSSNYEQNIRLSVGIQLKQGFLNPRKGLRANLKTPIPFFSARARSTGGTPSALV